MKVESVSEEISTPSQKWTPDGGRNSLDATRFGMAAETEKNYAYHLANNAYGGGNGYVREKKEKSPAAMVKADLGQRRRRPWRRW